MEFKKNIIIITKCGYNNSKKEKYSGKVSDK